MSVAQGHRERSRFDQERPVAWIYKLLIINIIIAVIPAIPAHAQAGTADKATLLANIEGACPGAWEAVHAGFIGGADTVADAWQGNATDRDAFIAYLQAEMANESLTAEELEAMASDPMAVVAECSYQKLQFIRFMALQAAEVTDVGSFNTGVGPGSLAVPDGSTQEQAAESCEFIYAAYPSSETGDYWIDTDGGDTSNAEYIRCVFGYDIRHLRFIAESEINGKAWTSVSELYLFDFNRDLLSRDNWEIAYVDSEELTGENGAATNAIDGQEATIWHTAWYGGSPPHPHELRIDLGELVSATGLKYLPRQNGQTNGTVGSVKIYGSDDGTTWTLLVSENLAADTSEKTINFK